MTYLIAFSIFYLSYYVLEKFILRILSSNLLIKNRVKQIQSYSGIQQKKNNKKDKTTNKKLNIAAPEDIKLMLYNSGVNLRVDEFIKIWMAVAVALPTISIVFSRGIIPTIILFVIGLVSPLAYLKVKVQKRVHLFNDQLAEALMIISNSLKAGFTFEQAITSIANDLPDPIGHEFKNILREVNLGVSMEDAMKHVAIKMNSKEMELLNTAVSIQRQVGGNLSQVIDSIANTIQERIKLRKKIKTLTAQGEMSGKVIASLPFVVLIMFSVLNPDYMKPMYTTTYGYALLTVSAILEIIGFATIKKITKVEM